MKTLQRGTQRRISQQSGVSESTVSRRVRSGDASTVIDGKRIEQSELKDTQLREKGLGNAANL